jgi:two-component system sensor histidine kinase KdpD
MSLQQQHDKRMPQWVFWGPVAVWSSTMALIYVLQDAWNLGSLSLLLVLASAFSALWLDTLGSFLSSAMAVLAFNWYLVTPRYTFQVEKYQDLVLLVVLLGTSSLVSQLTGRLRRSARTEQNRAQWAARLQLWVSTLSQATTHEAQIGSASQLLSEWVGAPARFHLQLDPPQSTDGAIARAWSLGLTATGSIGPGSGRFEDLAHWAVPLRTANRLWGCWLIGPLPRDTGSALPTQLAHIEALNREMGREMDRLQSQADQRLVQERLQVQQTRNTLLASISHDYRTPLATIMSAAHALTQPAASDALVQERAQIILEEAEHLGRMTTNLLQLGRLETPGVQIQLAPEAPEELVGVVLRACRRRHPGRDIRSQVPPDMPLVQCDPVLVVQLLDNLLENALKHGDPSQPVELQVQAQPQQITFAVLNRGHHIPDEVKDRLFEPFQRLPLTRFATTDWDQRDQIERAGMGLGLAVCKAIAKAHHAALWMQDRAGGGVQVVFALPALELPKAS